MKPLSVGGKHDLESFKNRLGRAYGQGLIDVTQFTRMSKKVEELLEELETIQKKE